MKNIHLILVNKVAASLYHCSNTRDFFTTLQTPDDLLYEMYITSDEEIKEGDWALQFNDIGTEPKIVFNVKYQIPPECVVKKIILTTDEYLINDGAQAIDDEFLEWICKNPSCEAVEVKSNYRVKSGTIQEHNEGKAGYEYYDYKIIIPKEEPKKECCQDVTGFYLGMTCPVCNKPFRSVNVEPKQETLEEAVERLYPKYISDPYNPSEDLLEEERNIFIEGAKWQAAKMYSEEEVITLLESLVEHPTKPGYKRKDILKVIEQFKNK